MATAVKQRRGTATEHDSDKGDGSGFTGLEGEITVDTTNDTIRVHDGSQVGGHRLAKYSELSTVATAITTTDESSDTTCFPLLSTDATGNLAAKTDASSLTYNASSGTLSATAFTGNLTGDVTGNVSGSSGSCTGNSATATTAGQATLATSASAVVTTTSGSGDQFVTFVDADSSSSQTTRVHGEVKYNTSNTTFTVNGTVSATTFSGALSGNATTASSASALDGTAKITTVVNSTLQTATNFFGQRMIHTGGAVTYSFAAVSSSDVGKSVTVINSGTASITLSITTSKFYDLTAGVAPDYSGSGSSSHTLLKGGVAEFIVTEANKMIIIGSGVI